MKRGQTLSLITLAEVVLAIAVVVTLWLIIDSMTTNAIFFQTFFAKDNAHLIETMHAVPNGEVHFGYLWNNKNFSFTVMDDKTIVENIEMKDGRVVVSGKIITKAFGKSSLLRIGNPGDTPRYQFTPEYYQYILSQVVPTGQNLETRVLIIEEDFNQLNCPGSPTKFLSIAVAANQSGFEQSTAEIFAIAVREGVTAQIPINGGSGQVSVRIELSKNAANETSVYYTKNDDQTLRIACFITRSITGEYNPRYGHISQAEKTIGEDILITIQGQNETAINEYMTKIRDGILASRRPNG